MKERPIIFSSEMVKAILAGTKTQTRRVITPQPSCYWSMPPARYFEGYFNRWGAHIDSESIKCPFGQVGDRLWVRETFVLEGDELGQDEPTDRPFKYDTDGVLLIPHYRATDPDPNIVPDYVDDFDDRTRWRPSIHMPRWASRITLETTEVRVERLQEITEEDSRAEGVNEISLIDRGGYFSSFADLWDSLNAKRGYGWETNPWVWVIGFKTIR